MSDRDDLQREVDEARERVAEDVDLLVDHAVASGKKGAQIAIPVVIVALVAVIWWKRTH